MDLESLVSETLYWTISPNVMPLDGKHTERSLCLQF